MTPNQMTFIGALFGFLGILCTFFVFVSKYFFIGTIIGLIIHLVADDLDGYIARTRNMSSKAGGYLDLITDIMFITFLLISIGLSGFVHLEVIVWVVPVYGLVIVTAMHYILHFNEFLFPRFGPIETHISLIVICILCMIFETEVIIEVKKFNFYFSDIIIILGSIPMYFEMFRLQIQLFRRLNTLDKGDLK